MGKRSMQLVVVKHCKIHISNIAIVKTGLLFGAVLYLLEYALDLNIHPDISIKILTPAKTDTGYIARAARGISIARRVSAPAGGIYILNE